MSTLEIEMGAMNIAEMKTFKKWSSLVPELREHSLSYFGSNSLYQYAQCSKLSNEEIQKFDTYAPSYVGLKEHGDGMVVKLEYNRRRIPNLLFAKFDETHYEIWRSDTNWNNLIIEGNPRDAALQYFLKRFKYLKTGTTSIVDIDCETWPSEIETVPIIYQAKSWNVQLYSGIYERFMNTIHENRNVKDLCFPLKWDQEDMMIPTEFFKSNLFKQLNRVYFRVKSLPQDDDFLESNASYLYFNCDTISNNGIHRKIQSWYDGRITELEFSVNFSTPRVVNRSEILRDIPVINPGNEFLFIVQRPDGKLANIFYHDKGVLFKLRSM